MSYKIEHILVPVDFSDCAEIAVKTAASMAKLFNADLTLMHVVEYNEYFITVLPEAQAMMPDIESIREETTKKMGALEDHIKQHYGLNPKSFITSGNIETEIRNYATENMMSVIVMGTHGVSGYKEIFMGSNSQRVVTLSEIPVLTVTKDSSKGFQNILMTFDDALYSRQKVNIAITIAEKYHAHVHLVGILKAKNSEEIHKLKIKLHSVEELITERKLFFSNTIIIADNMASTAMKYAMDNVCDLMVINTGHESEITGVFLGAFAQQIVNHSDIPVLSVKPMSDSYSIATPGFGV